VFVSLSTRAMIQTGDELLIGGFTIPGTVAKSVLIRALGPSLLSEGIVGVLANPVLELFDINGNLIAQNDNWRDTQEAEIEATGLAPSNDLESAMVVSLLPSSYSAVVAGFNNGTGVGLFEIFDLDLTVDAQLGNLSSRGFVGIGEDVLVGGFVIANGTTTTVLVRAIGPSLSSAGILNALQDPTLELRDANGVLLAFDNNWKDSQESDIEATGLAPTDDRESAILATLLPGTYTMTVQGLNATTGVALVEVDKIQ